ncbi:hypothetical protein DEJ04_09615 [Curtobacterium sp. MCLR17_044]|nr:hypothetical protein DEJ04_09615 [Curtobacterium sp. MCLR17_044]
MKGTMSTNEQSPQSLPPQDERTGGDRPARFRWARTVAAVVGAVLGGLVVVLAAGNLVPATSNIVTLGGSMAWGYFAPHLVIVSVIAVLLCVPLWRARRRPVIRGIASVLALGALVASTGITAALVHSATANGGSVNFARTLALTNTPVTPTKITTYVTAGGKAQQARIYEPKGGPKGAPVMMYIHGGGWYGGTAEESDSLAQRWADRGWYVVNVDYRLADATHATWDEAPADVACALTWTDKLAKDVGADTGKLTVMGDSAGGHLAMLLGWSAAAGAAPSTCPGAGKVPVPDAVVAGYPVSNIDYTYDHGASPLPSFNPQEFTRFFLGGAPADVPDHVRAVSPSTYLSAAIPATLVLQPERDDFIPAKGNDEVMKQAKQAGADATIVQVPFAWHGFDATEDSIGGQVKMTVTENWLEKRNLAP